MIKELKKEAQGLSVLFVEDDANFLGIIKEMLDRFFGRVERQPWTAKRGF